MIVGFDNDAADIFDAHRRFIAEARIVNPLINVLIAIPGTPLFARLQKAARIDPSAELPYGTNIIPLKMTREELQQGCLALARDLYESSAYFGRLDALYLDDRLEAEPARKRYLARHRWRWFKANTISLIQAGAILLGLLLWVPEPALSREYRRRMWQALRRRHDPFMLRIYALKCAIHYHMHVMLRQPGESCRRAGQPDLATAAEMRPPAEFASRSA